MRITRTLHTIMSPAYALSPVEYSPIKTLKYAHPSGRKTLPAVWMRSGTSKGLFIHWHHLPASTHLWEQILLSAMGSSQGDGRQINGVGGASSTTSKVAVVKRSNRPNVDVDYTFVQVAPDQPRIDMTGNCGNIAAGVGPFALDEGIVRATQGQKEVSLASPVMSRLVQLLKLTSAIQDRRSNLQHQHRTIHSGIPPGCPGRNLPGRMWRQRV
jgi:hypothetical protein